MSKYISLKFGPLELPKLILFKPISDLIIWRNTDQQRRSMPEKSSSLSTVYENLAHDMYIADQRK